MLNIIYSITFCFEIIFFWRKILLIIVALRNAIKAQLLENRNYIMVCNVLFERKEIIQLQCIQLNILSITSTTIGHCHNSTNTLLIILFLTCVIIASYSRKVISPKFFEFFKSDARRYN